jgi:predicted metal-binding membrane protein
MLELMLDRPMSTTINGQRSVVERFGIPALLLLLAAVGWWWSTRMVPMESMGSMPMMSHDAMSFGAFLIAWLAMMSAMMLPAISPVVQLYARGAAAGRVAPLPFFVIGYIAVWTALGIPAFFVWRALIEPIADGMTWVAYLAGGVLIAAALWQLTPLKAICLRHCRSPMSVFMRFGSTAAKPVGAARMGATHGAYCVGCCWALMAVLVAIGTMNIAWMLGLAALILLEKNAPWGERIATIAAGGMAVLGVVLIVRPETLAQLT